MLLGSVVDVALQASTFLVLRGHDPLPGGTEIGGLLRDLHQSSLQIGGEPRVREHEPRLLRETVQELGFPGAERFARRLGHGDRAEELSLVAHGRNPVGIDRGELVALHRERTLRFDDGPRGREREPVP